MDTTRWDMFRLDCPDCDLMNSGLAPIRGEEDDPRSNRVMCWGCGTVFELQPEPIESIS